MQTPIIPAPQLLTAHASDLRIDAAHLLILAAQLEPWAPGAALRLTQFARDLTSHGAPRPVVASVHTESNPVTVTAQVDPGQPAEAFALTATNANLTLAASDAGGALYGVNALIQALRTGTPYEFTAASAPKYAFRGFMLDISRHFFGVPEIKTVIDLASQYNLNRLHLHLSDDQGWRIEIVGRPELTEIGSTNDADGGPGGFLTIAQYEEIQDYAALFGMDVVPEIDLPGHTNALQVACPELTPDGLPREHYAGIEVGFSYVHLTSDKTWAVLEDVVASLARTTRSEYLHMGGDEVLKVERPEYEEFMTRLGQLVAKYGKKMTLWHEGAGATLPEGTQLQYWTQQFNTQKLTEAMATPGLEVIASPAQHAYVDLKPTEDFPLGLTWAGLNDLKTSFNWAPEETTPVPANLITGVETCLWTETIRSLDDITTMMLPRIAGVAAVAWGSARDFDQFTRALPSHGRAWAQASHAFYRDPSVDWDEQDQLAAINL